MATTQEYDETWRVPPELQQQRDRVALALKEQELADDPQNPALQRDVAFTRDRLSSGTGLGPSVGGGGGGAPLMPPAPGPGGLNLRTTTPQIQSLEAQQQAFQQQSNARLQELSQGRDIAAQGAIDALRQPHQTFEQFSEGRRVPLPRYEAQPYSQENALAFGAIATAFAALAGLRTRTPLTAAMNAAGQAMQGYTTGRLIEVNTELNTFRTQFNSALASNEQMLKEYQSIINDRNLTRAEKMAEWQVAAARWKDEATMAMMRNNQYDLAIHRLYTSLGGANKLAQHADEFEKGLRNKIEVARIGAQARVDARGNPANIAPEAIDNAAAFYILNGRMPIGFARLPAETLGAIQNRAAEMTKAAGLTPEQFAAAGPITRQKLGALMALEKNRNAIGAYEQMLDLNIDVLKGLSNEVERTDSPYANKSILWLKQNVQGDEKVAEYLFQVNTVATEIARVLNNPNLTGQLTDTARGELENVVRGELSPKQLEAVLRRAQADARNRSRSFDRQVDSVIKEIRDPLHRSGGPMASPGGGSQYREGQTATGPNGEKATFRNGQWVVQ